MINAKHPMLYRVIAQTDALTITAETSKEVTAEEAADIARKEVLSPNGSYNCFVIQPICTKFEWVNGHINFCPRCGKSINEQMGGGPDNDIATNSERFSCDECEAEISVTIHYTPDEDEEDEEKVEEGTRWGS